MYIPGTDRDLDWSGAPEPERTVTELIGLLGGVGFAAYMAAGALISAPSELGANARVSEVLPRLTKWRRRLGGLIVLDTMPSPEEAVKTCAQWLDDADPPLRRAAALFASAVLGAVGSARALVIEALEDPDAEVRDEVLTALKESRLDEALRDAVARASEGVDGWVCGRCGAQNQASESSCENCNTVGPELKRHIDKLLSLTES